MKQSLRDLGTSYSRLAAVGSPTPTACLLNWGRTVWVFFFHSKVKLLQIFKFIEGDWHQALNCSLNKKKMLRFFDFSAFWLLIRYIYFLAMMQQSVKCVEQFKLWYLWFWAQLKMCVRGHAGELCGCDGVFQSFRSCPQSDTQWLKGLWQIVGLLEPVSWLNTTLVMWGSRPQTDALLSVTTLSSLSQMPQYAELTNVF